MQRMDSHSCASPKELSHIGASFRIDLHSVKSKSDGKMSVVGLHRRAGAVLQHLEPLTRAAALNDRSQPCKC